MNEMTRNILPLHISLSNSVCSSVSLSNTLPYAVRFISYCNFYFINKNKYREIADFK